VLLDDARPFTSLLQAQAALDDWVREYNASRPHQALDVAAPVTPAERFQPVPAEQRQLLAIWLPGALAPVCEPAGVTDRRVRRRRRGRRRRAVELDRVVPPSGNLWVACRQFWLGPQRAGQTVRFWASVDVICLSIAGARVKSLRSHLSRADLTGLAHDGASPAGPSPLPAAEPGGAVEVDRSVSNAAIVSLAGRQVLAAEILRSRHVTIRIEPDTYQ
jgi:hypothetical protein